MQNEAQYDLDRKAAKISALSSNNLDKYEYLTAEDLGLKPNTIEQDRFEYSPLGKIFNKELDKDDQKEGLFKRLKNIENVQKDLINGNNRNKPDSERSKLSLPSIFDSISSESKDEDEKTAHEFYQDEIEGMKGPILPGEIEIKDEKSQMYLENNFNKINNNFPDIYDKHQRFSKYIANKEKENIDYEILSSKVNDINFYDRFNTLYNYFSTFNAKEISIKNISFLKDLLKGFKLKSVYTTNGENNIEKAYDDLVFNNKKIDDVLYKKVNNKLSNRGKNIFQEAKKLFDLRVEIYKMLVLEEENLKFEKSFGETVNLKSQNDNLSETLEQKKFIEYIEDESKDINYDLFKEYFNFEVPTVLAKKIYEINNKKKNNDLVESIKIRWSNFKDEIEKMSKEEIENEKPDKILEIVEEILNFNNKIKKQSGQGFKMLTSNQMLSRLPITLAQLKAGNNSEKLKNEIRQLLYSFYRSKKLTKQLYKSLVDII